MADREKILSDQTFKGKVDDLGQRIFYTLFYKSDATLEAQLDEKSKVGRTQKLLAGLIEKLHSDGVLDDADIDELLFNVVQS